MISEEPSLGTYEEFFALPHTERLAMIRQIKGSGQKVADLVKLALNDLPTGKVSEIELFAILCDYVSSPLFQAHYDTQDYETADHGEWGLFTASQDIEALWGLIPKLPEWMTHALLQLLPAQGGLFFEIPEIVLKRLNAKQLGVLFNRRDVRLTKQRRETFFSHNQADRDIRQSAVLYNFNLLYEQFGEIVKSALSGSEGSEAAWEDLILLTYADDLSFVFYDALSDVFSLRAEPDRKKDAARAHDKLLRKIAEKAERQFEYYLWELRIYRLTKRIVPWGPGTPGASLPKGLRFLKSCIVEGDTWESFVSFSREWRIKWPADDLKIHLPGIEEPLHA